MIPTKREADVSELVLTTKLLEQLGELCMSSNYADITLVADQNTLPAHRCILAARSSYFRALLYSKENNTSTTIRDVGDELRLDLNGILDPFEALKHVLKFIYTGCVSLNKMEHVTMLDVLNLAHKYGIEELEFGISAYLIGNISLQNSCAVLNVASSYKLVTLKDAVLSFMDENSREVVNSSNFKTLTRNSLNLLLERDSFYAPEIEIFKAVVEWRKQNNSDTEFQAIISLIRFELMDMNELLTIVKESSLFDSESLLETMRQKAINKNLKYRFITTHNENIASSKAGAKAIHGNPPSEINDENSTSYDAVTGYTSHNITTLPQQEQYIMLDLNAVYMMNHIKFLLWDKDNRSYSYYVECSVDRTTWTRVADYTKFLCRSWQNLHFKSCPVRYIKLVGTHNTANTVFHVVELEAYYSDNQPKLVNEMISPTFNVATKEKGANVIEGICNAGDTLDVLLNGEVTKHTGHSGYVYHNLGTGNIVIQLAQPFVIGSLRLLLWDQDTRAYGFYIETSMNNKDWEMAVDKRNDKLKAWQEFTFSPRPVTFIKIVGTINTVNNGFHIVHFEAPSTTLPN